MVRPQPGQAVTDGGEGAQTQRLQDLARRVDLLAAVTAGARRQRHPDRVADPLGEQHAERGRRPDQALDRPSPPRSGRGAAAGGSAGRARGRPRSGRLGRETLQEMTIWFSVSPAASAASVERERRERPCTRSRISSEVAAEVAVGVLLHLRHHQVVVERAGVDADAHRFAVLARRRGRWSRTVRRAGLASRRCQD